MHFLTFIFLFSVSSMQRPFPGDSINIRRLYIECGLSDNLEYKIFKKAFEGYSRIPNLRKKDILTIIDYSRSSLDKRLYVIDLNNKKLLFNCLVAHGKNSGELFATSFSNDSLSLKSSLGFFITGEAYSGGKHGYSLRLDGLEENINNKARARDIVIHGAFYVSEKFIHQYGILGRSWGCPAVPEEIVKGLIDTISNGSCLFIYADDKFYNENSRFR